MKKKLATLMFSSIVFGHSLYAAENNVQIEANNTTQFQKVVDEYKAFLADVNVKVREEIIIYRKEIARLNRLKRETYQKLTQDGQAFLAKEQEFKKKLPLKQRKLINITNPGEKIDDKDKSE